MAAPASQPVRSTLLDGNHAFPPLYACYLLRSKTRPNVTYIGSSPDPPRRLRQHNGEITQGAVSTMKYRPWEMQMIVYGFPSKLTALQFEWAWQKPDLSRHLKQPVPSSASSTTTTTTTSTSTLKDPSTNLHTPELSEPTPVEVLKPIFPRNALRNRVETKMAVARTMLTVSPFRRWPLHVRVFTREAWEIWGGFKVVGYEEEEGEAVGSEVQDKDKVKGKGKGKAVNAKVKKPPGKRKTLAEKRTYDPLPEVTTVMLDLGGVDGQAPGRTEGTKGVTKIDGPIDVEDTEFRGMVWDKWKAFREGAEGSGGECAVCKEVIEDVDDHLNVAFCVSSAGSDAGRSIAKCYSIAHLPCLAKHFLANPGSEESVTSKLFNPILPHTGHCPGCNTRSDWGEIIRGIYARRDGEKENVELTEKARLRDMKAAELAERLAERKRKVDEEKEVKRRKTEEAKEERRRMKELENADKPKVKRRAKSKVSDSSESE